MMCEVPRRLRRVLVASIGTALVACGEDGPAEPAPPVIVQPTLRIIAGGTGSDTIGTELRQGLVVEVTGVDGKPRPGVAVRFSSLNSLDSARRGAPTVLVGKSLTSGYNTFASDTTNGVGRAIVPVRLGGVAGPGRLLITVIEFGLQDTARYTITPGNAAAVRFVSGDTVLGVGKQATLRATVIDAFENTRPEVPTLSTRSSSCSTAGLVVRGERFGSCQVIAALGRLSDTLEAAVVPNISVVGLAFVAGRFQVQRVNLETGQRTVIVDRFDGGNEAFPHESKGDVVFRDGQRLVMITSAGRRIDPLVSFPNLGWHGWARWTRTNDWIYFSGSLGLMRVRPDGTLPQEIASFGTYPDPSPNGTRLAWGDGNSLYVMDLTAPALTSPIATGAVPRWSPDGSLLAFVGQGQLRIARPDGTNLRVLTPNGVDERSLDWTPDGEWILVSFVGVPTLVKADGTDRISLPLSNIFQLSVARP